MDEKSDNRTKKIFGREDYFKCIDELLQDKNYYRVFLLYWVKILPKLEGKETKEDEEIRKEVLRRYPKLFRELFFKDGRLISIKNNPVLKSVKKDKKYTDVVNREYVDLMNYNPWNKKMIGLLKEKKEDEKGIISINYTCPIEYFCLNYDLNKLKKDYKIILFPSCSIYQHPIYLCYIGEGIDVFLASPYEPDYNFIKSLSSNLIPFRLGHGDFVKPSEFNNNNNKEVYDICMMAYNDPFKDYSSLIKMIGELKDNEKFKIYFATNENNDKEIRSLCKKEGVKSDITIGWKERSGWWEVLQSSRVFVLNSKREGHCMALSDALFADCPVMMNKRCVGNNHNFINKKTGVFFTEKDFGEKLSYLLENRKSFSPRKWAMKNTGCFNARKKLNKLIKKDSLNKGEKWTKDIAQTWGAVIKYINKEDEYLGDTKDLDKYKIKIG